MNKNFTKIDNKYRPIPFWSWNTKLDTEETKRQINKMNEVGIGGFFMHARGGLSTEYMGKEWFDNVGASIEEAKKLGMSAWAYDENGYVLNIQNRACSLKRPVEIKCIYTADIKTIPEKLYLVCEKPNQYDIFVNGLLADKTDLGYFVDSSFRKLDISKLVRLGKNEITLICYFMQSKKVYENLEKALIFESERNKLSYDMEIEPIYLCGDFGVYAKNNFVKLDKDAVRIKNSFYIDKCVKEISLKNIEQQGFLFFAGRIKLTREFDISDKNCKIVFDKTGINAINVFVNGKFVDTLLWEPLECDLSAYVKEGKNTLTLEVVNNLRNMLGPHHLKEGESLNVAPRQFFKEKCFWAAEPEKSWDDDYCFVEVSLIK